MMALTVTAINAAKSKDKPYELTDGLGLYLLLTEKGGRLWRMNYSFCLPSGWPLLTPEEFGLQGFDPKGGEPNNVSTEALS